MSKKHSQTRTNAFCYPSHVITKINMPKRLMKTSRMEDKETALNYCKNLTYLYLPKHLLSSTSISIKI